ncbi:conserved hypothetical protein [Theileria orientalis strain Shintoku]|uniref:Uncharacterized protein n=1 Tax=Theileria orientalis strain Shintoku TaxID=869250 RepID=J7M842_THEOR|nr:conserved hypothetical protein [Theileria orientalis strain Shintoku]PVC50331.1 hypothetical protein MACL_00002366 [Theileria orientalis]BAM38608.1 conserved hypothetical protein [Theileria orientalis strain Shintoku]|eukprot:XP_009688909.1 conserved hypothetical protein [Theileria orientalis strain Shintoku]
MLENEENTFIYIQDENSLESDLIKTKYKREQINSQYSFDRSTPRLSYSNTVSPSSKNYIDTSHSIPSRLESVYEGRSSTAVSSKTQNCRGYLDVNNSRVPGGRSYTSASKTNTGRSSTCNVTIPCESVKNTKAHLPKKNIISTSTSSTVIKNSDYFGKPSKSKREQRQNKSVIDLESQKTMETSVDTESIISKVGRDVLLAPEFASDERTRKFLSLFRELYVAIIGCQLVYVLTTLLFGNAALSIIVTLLLIQSCFCHADGRPMAYLVNGLLSLAIGITVIVALAQDVAGLEPFRTEPVLKTLSYVYIPLCFLFTLLSVFLALGFRRLHQNERKAIVNAANNLLGKEYFVDQKSLLISKRSTM